MRLNSIKLVSVMRQQEITQRELAKRSGLSLVTVNNICNGRRCAEITGDKIATALGIDIKELVEIN